MAAFAWKVSCAHPGKRLLLKSPSHTGKAAEIERLFGGRVRFVHLARDPVEVVRSNVAMHTRLESQSLQVPPSPAETREAVIGEYVEAERRFDEQAGAMGDRVVRLRYDELVATPLDELARLCEALGLRWDDRVRERAARYLVAVGDYTPRQHADTALEDPRLAALAGALGVGGGVVGGAMRERGSDASPGLGVRRSGAWRGVLAVWVMAAVGLGIWLGLAHLTHHRLDVLAWPLGGLVGAVTLRVAGWGDWKLGLWAAAGAFALVAASVWPLPAAASGWTGEDRLRNLSTAYGTFNNNYLYLLFGMLTAYRYASRKFARPPGM
jgi:hypothetical protein